MLVQSERRTKNTSSDSNRK